MKETYERRIQEIENSLTVFEALVNKSKRALKDLKIELGMIPEETTPKEEVTKVEVIDLEATKLPKYYYSQLVTDTRWGNEILVTLGLAEIIGVKSIVVHRAFTTNKDCEKVFCDMGSKDGKRKPYYICVLKDKDGNTMKGWWQTSKGKAKDGTSRGKELGKKFNMDVFKDSPELMKVLIEHHYDAIDKERDWMPCTVEFLI